MHVIFQRTWNVHRDPFLGCKLNLNKFNRTDYNAIKIENQYQNNIWKILQYLEIKEIKLLIWEQDISPFIQAVFYDSWLGFIALFIYHVYILKVYSRYLFHFILFYRVAAFVNGVITLYF